MRPAIVFMLLACARLASAGATCPENSVASGGGFDAISLSSTAPTGTFGDYGVVPWSMGTACLNGCYDLPNGVVAARGASNTQGGGFGAVRAADVYSIVGPAGPPLTFQAMLRVNTQLTAYTGYLASITSGAKTATCSTGPSCQAAITLSYAPGESFLLSADLSVSGFDGIYPPDFGSATGQIWFSGLPAGYSVVSCQNYDLPTPARPSSWGGVKALYR